METNVSLISFKSVKTIKYSPVRCTRICLAVHDPIFTGTYVARYTLKPDTSINFHKNLV